MSAATVRRMFDTLNAEDLDVALELFTEDFYGEVPPELSGEPDEYRGHAGVRRYFETFRDVVDDLRFDADELVEVTDTAVVARGCITGRGRGSGIPVEMRVPLVIRLRGGKVSGMAAYPEWDDAVAAARAG